MNRMRLKKWICGVLCLVMLCSLVVAMTGCGGEEKQDAADRHVMVTYFYGENLPKDVDLVEAAINEYLSELGSDITMEYYPMSVYSQNYTTVLLTDEIDLMCVAFGSSPQYYAQMEMIQPITEEELAQYCPHITEMNEEYDMRVRTADGTIVGIATREMGVFNGGCYMIRQSDLEAIGLSEQYPDGTYVTYEDLRTIFTKLKETYPDSYPIGTKLDESGYTAAVDPLGSSKASSGVLDFSDNGFESTKVVNYYETDVYVNYCKFMAECLENGWLDSEAETSTVSKIAAFKNGVSRGVWLTGTPSLRVNYSTDVGEQCVRLQVVEPYYVSLRSEGITWAVAGTSEKKAATLEFLDLFWSDKKLMNMIQWGIEGTHFDVVDEENGIIEFANGLTGETSGYYMGGGFYGDKRYIYTFRSPVMTLEEQIASKVEEQAAMDQAAKKQSPAGNFIYDSTEYNITIKNIESVIDRYANIMALGGYTEEVYKEFITGLKEAGMEEVIADKQQQLDTYLAGIGK